MVAIVAQRTTCSCGIQTTRHAQCGSHNASSSPCGTPRGWTCIHLLPWRYRHGREGRKSTLSLRLGLRAFRSAMTRLAAVEAVLVATTRRARAGLTAATVQGTNTHTQTYTHTHSHTHTLTHTCIHSYMHACMHAYIHTCKHNKENKLHPPTNMKHPPTNMKQQRTEPGPLHPCLAWQWGTQTCDAPRHHRRDMSSHGGQRQQGPCGYCSVCWMGTLVICAPIHRTCSTIHLRHA